MYLLPSTPPTKRQSPRQLDVLVLGGSEGVPRTRRDGPFLANRTKGLVPKS